MAKLNRKSTKPASNSTRARCPTNCPCVCHNPAPSPSSTSSSSSPSSTSQSPRHSVAPTARQAIRASKKRSPKKKRPATGSRPTGVTKRQKQQQVKLFKRKGDDKVTLSAREKWLRDNPENGEQKPKRAGAVPVDTYTRHGYRYLCPRNVPHSSSGARCNRHMYKAADLRAHVRGEHHGTAGWGMQPADWVNCGPFTAAQLAARGVNVARRPISPVPGTAPASASAPASDDERESQSEEEEEGEEEEEDSGSNVILSDGDEADSDNESSDGRGDGHALAQPIAV